MGAEKLLQYWERQRRCYPKRAGRPLSLWNGTSALEGCRRTTSGSQRATNSWRLTDQWKERILCEASGTDSCEKSWCGNLVFHDFIAKQHSFSTGSDLQIFAQRV